MKEKRRYKIYHNADEGTLTKIFCRLPFTMYFVGKRKGVEDILWSKLYLFRKEFDGVDYYFEKV